MLRNFCNLTSSIGTEICVVNLCQVIVTSISCLWLFFVELFVWIKYGNRSCFVAQRLHCIRSALELLLFIVGTVELASALLPGNIRHGGAPHNVQIPFRTECAVLTMTVAVTLGIYHYVVETKSYPVLLCHSIFIETAISIVRIYKLVVVSQDYDFLHLEVFTHYTALSLLLTLISIDSFILYKERHKARLKASRDENEKPNIGYKHTTAPFISKVFFWWLNPLLWKGYKNPLEQEDIGSMREEDSARSHYDQFLFIYKTEKAKCAQLWFCYLKSSWKLFILGGLLKLLGDLSALVGPLSIYQIVEYIEEQQRNPEHKLHKDSHKTNGNDGSVSIGHWGTPARTMAGIGGYTSIATSEDTIQDAIIYYPGWDELLSNGWVIAWFVLLSALAQGALSQAATHIVNMIGIRIKTSLQGLVYRKMLLLSSSCLYKSTVTDGGMVVTSALSDSDGTNSLALEMNAKDVGAITNLMSEDALNVMTFFWIAHYVWSIPLKVGLVMYLLYLKLGISAIIGSFVCILTMVPLQFLIGKAMSSNAEKAAECSDQRLRKTNDVFMGIKIIKLNAWEKVFQEKITKTRNEELKYLNRDSIYWFLMTTLAHISSVLITFVTLAVFIKLESDTPQVNNLPSGINMSTNGSNDSTMNSTSYMNLTNDDNKGNNGEIPLEFTASRLFSALALFNQLTVPLFIFPITVPIIISAIVSTKRLERFLREPEVEREFEGIRNMARILSKSDASLDMYESSNDPSMVETFSTVSEQISLPSEPKTPPPLNLTAQDPLARFSQGFNSLPKKKTEIVRNSRVESVRLRQKASASRESIRFSASENMIVSISNAIFVWDRGNTRLRVNHLEIPKGKLTVIVGRSGSGKTSLTSALLKEMHLLSGDVAWNKYATIAYVPQTPWLLNSTIRENILFGESYRPKRYDKVLDACALKPDLELMPSADMTVIDERGINLSGGQKQRVAIARALYSSANFIIMDDPLSSLDNEVAKHVYDNSIKKMLLRAGRTVIMATQRLHLVYSADYIIAMKDCQVEAAGTFAELERKHPRVVMEWSGIMSKGASGDQISNGKTARERWRLFKNISKLGLQRVSNSETENMSSTQSLRTSKRRQSIHGSRHLTYDIPLPIDECHNDDLIILRRENRRSRKCHSLDLAGEKKGVLRVNSLQSQPMRLDRASVTRIVSSPISLYDTRTKMNENDMKARSGFRQFLHRMSSRRSNNDMSMSRHKPLRVSNSIQSITEEVHLPVSRLVSDSSNSSVLIDDDSVADGSDNETAGFVYDEERKYGEIPASVYFYYLKSCGIVGALLYILSALIWQCIRVYTDFWLRNWTDDTDPNNTMYYFQMYAFISNLCIVVSLISTSAGQIAGCKARKKLHNDLLEAIFSKSFYFFQTSPLGRILNRFSHDMAIVDKKITATTQRLLQFMLLCLFAVLINTSITPWFVVLTVPICAAYYFIQKFYRCSSRELQRIESITNSPVLSHFTETVEGVTTIRAYNQESRFTEIMFKKLEAHNAAFIVLNTSNRWLGIALDYLGGVIVFIAIITALLVSTLQRPQVNNGTDDKDGAKDDNKEFPPQTLSASMVGMAINYTLFIPIYLNWVVKLLADMEMYIGAVERIAYYGETEDQEDSSSNGRLYTSVPISWPTKSDITFQNVTLCYEGHQNQNVIKNLTLKIPSGQRIGICGRTGSGKSSLVLSLFGVLKVVEGQILIDDVDITTVNPDEIRSRLSIIPQDVHLFNATIRENLDPRGYYTDLQLWNCLELAQLKDIVKRLPLGIETEIVDGGSNLSAGQRQLFCLARAILRGSVCLILDEATSSLDGETEAALLAAADNAFKGRTIITIAHRLTTILNYDRIIVLENGEIVEDGSPSVLESVANGKFATMLKTATT